MLQMRIDADAADRVTVHGGSGTWQEAGTTVVDGREYHVLEHENKQLLIGVAARFDVE